MLIKHQQFKQHLQRQLLPVYLLAGPDLYSIEKEFKALRQIFSSQQEADYKIITVDNASDWQQLHDELNSYSLFSEATLIDVRFEKKTIDSSGKKILADYLKQPNRDKLLVIRSPQVPAKQLSWVSSSDQAAVVTAYPPEKPAMLKWVDEQLIRQQYQFEKNIPQLIVDHANANMMACAQSIRKIILVKEPGSSLTTEDVLEQLFDQSEYQLYDLKDQCLTGNAEAAIKICRNLQRFRSEATLILWMLCQEIRLLYRIQQQLSQGISFSNACQTFRIWSNKTMYYQKALKRLTLPQLERLLAEGILIDENIKQGKQALSQQRLEKLILSFCQPMAIPAATS